MSENAYAKAEMVHERVKYHLEQDIKKYAPYVPEVQIMLIPPKGTYCNANYDFCPYLLWGGFCTKLEVQMHPVDGYQFTTITAKQLHDIWGVCGKSAKNHNSGVAIGSYRVFKKICTGK